MRQHPRRYHTIPLRRRAQMPHAGQMRATTSRPTASPDRVSREASIRQTLPTEAPRPLAPRHPMPPIMADDAWALPSQRSAIRYTDTQGRDVIEQGDRRLVIQRTPRQKRRVSRVLFVGIGMLAMLAIWLAVQALTAAVQAHNLDAQYGYPRFWQTDQVLGLDHDSPRHQTHLVLQNVNGHVFLLVLPAGDVSKALMYSVANLYGDDAANWPVTATFADVNHDGKIDVLVHIDDQQAVFLNTGTGLKEQTQS